jgi:hypothetical protein
MKYGYLILLFPLLIVNFLVAQNESDLKGAYVGQNLPGDTPELFAPGIVSTCKEHSAAMFTPDGNEVWFARLFPSAIYFMKQEDDKWTKPQVAPFSGQFDDLYPYAKDEYPYISPDGKYLFFNSNRPSVLNKNKIPDGPGNIYWLSARFIQKLK